MFRGKGRCDLTSNTTSNPYGCSSCGPPPAGACRLRKRACIRRAMADRAYFRFAWSRTRVWLWLAESAPALSFAFTCMMYPPAYMVYELLILHTVGPWRCLPAWRRWQKQCHTWCRVPALRRLKDVALDPKTHLCRPGYWSSLSYALLLFERPCLFVRLPYSAGQVTVPCVPAHGEFLPQRRPETVATFRRACCRAECNCPSMAYT